MLSKEIASEHQHFVFEHIFQDFDGVFHFPNLDWAFSQRVSLCQEETEKKKKIDEAEAAEKVAKARHGSLKSLPSLEANSSWFNWWIPIASQAVHLACKVILL